MGSKLTDAYIFLQIHIFVTGCDSRHYLGCYEEDGEWLGDCNVPESGDPTSWNRPYYQFAWNLCGLICIIAWVTITVGPLMGLFNYFGILRYYFGVIELENGHGIVLLCN